jgi:hypothetical protein
MPHQVAGTVPSSSTKQLRVLVPPAASSRAQPLFRRRLACPGGRHFGWAQLAAVSNPGATAEFISTKNQQLDAKLRFPPIKHFPSRLISNSTFLISLETSCAPNYIIVIYMMPQMNIVNYWIGWTNTSMRRWQSKTASWTSMESSTMPFTRVTSIKVSPLCYTIYMHVFSTRFK